MALLVLKPITRRQPSLPSVLAVQPVPDQGADLGAPVLLEKMAGSLDQVIDRAPERSGERLARRGRERAVLGAPKQQHRPGVAEERAQDVVTRARAAVGGAQRHEARKGARAGLARLARERGVVGGGDLVAGVGSAAAAHDQADRQLVDALDE